MRGVTDGVTVSTHSRPKAAGWVGISRQIRPWFQLTAARRRLVWQIELSHAEIAVSTHSRPKAAGLNGTLR